MKRIKEDITIGKGEDISILQKAKVDGKVVLPEQEGDSILQHMIHAIASFAAGGRPVNNGYFNGILAGGDSDDYEGNYFSREATSSQRDTWLNVDSVSGSGPVSVSCSGSYNDGLLRGYPISDLRNRTEFGFDDVYALVLTNVRGNSSLNGVFTDFNIIDQLNFELNGVSVNGSEDLSNAHLTWLCDQGGYLGGPNQDLSNTTFLEFDNIVLGRSSEPNDIRLNTMREPIMTGDNPGQLQYNANTLNAPVINLDQQISTITVSREVQNNTSSDIRAREIGLATRYHNYPNVALLHYCILSRDVIDVTIPSGGSIISIDYSIRTSCEDSGGIMTNFNEMIYRHLSVGSRTVQDVNNADQNDGPSLTQFDVRDFDGYLNGGFGVVVGTSNTVVDEADTSLYSKVTNGVGDGDLFRVGNYISPLIVDDANSEAYVDLTSIYENRGSTSIDLKEIGLYTNGPSGIVIIARSLLGTTQTVSPGETVEVTYRVKGSL